MHLTPGDLSNIEEGYQPLNIPFNGSRSCQLRDLETQRSVPGLRAQLAMPDCCTPSERLVLIREG